MAEQLTAYDAAELEGRGIPADEARRQLEQLLRPPYYAPLLRACTLGDGVISINQSQHAYLLSLHRDSAVKGRFTKFVPASGAASRMFRDLLVISERVPLPKFVELTDSAHAGDKTASSVLRFLSQLEDFAFYHELEAQLKGKGFDINALRKGDGYIQIIQALVGESGLGYAQLPKGLLKFHRYGNTARTPFEEHFAEAKETVQDKNGVCRMHFTVSPEHSSKFESLAQQLTSSTHSDGVKYQVSFSTQKSSTDMIALAEDGKPFREPKSGKILLRPGGHGALIENLNDLNADIIYIKNIDNVQPESGRHQTLLYKRLLGGFLVDIQNQIFARLDKLTSPQLKQSDIPEAFEFAREKLNLQIPENTLKELKSSEEKRDYIYRTLNRPVRICGVVKNEGEPGGGPFWIAEQDVAPSMQIVEEVQVDSSNPEQLRMLKTSTHFNPVDLVCAVRDHKGNKFDLRQYIDHNSTILSKKSHQGKDITVAERPGLWNGAMAGWITIFVEVPAITFTPVKTVNDLLKPEHRA